MIPIEFTKIQLESKVENWSTKDANHTFLSESADFISLSKKPVSHISV